MSPSPAAGGLAETAAAVEAAALGVPGVVALHGGALGEVAVYLPGRRVSGVRLREDLTEVHVVVALGSPVRATADQVQRAVAATRPGRVDVVVEDVRDTRPSASAAATPGRTTPETPGPA